MAIFWKHIKGTGDLTTKNSGLWTWIKWSNGEGATPSTAFTSTIYSPEIWVHTANADPYSIPEGEITTIGKNLGHIITSDAEDQIIKNQIAIPFIHTNEIHYDSFNEGLAIYRSLNQESPQLSFDRDGITTFTTIQSDVKPNSSPAWQISPEGVIKVTGVGYIEAPYFNATSDKRAKDNLSPLLTNALDIINNVHVYTFNYKNNPNDKTIGVIAQEFLDKKLDGVSLVANEAATGENGDYMTIKETKLIYLLLKGMQEQQEEINLLKQRIEQLESK